MYLKEWDQARQCLVTSLTLSSHQQTFIVLARVFLMSGDVAGAVRVYKDAVKTFPENPELNTTLGLLQIQLGNHQAAFECLGTALAFDPKNCKAILAAGSLMQTHQDYDVALSKYKIATQSMPESPPLWNNIGMCFFGKAKYVAAICCLKRAAYLAPFDWKILYNLGLVHLSMQQYASAFHFLSASINLRPSRGQTFMLMAVALSHLDDPENATAAYEQAISLDARDPAVAVNFAVFLAGEGDAVAAAHQLKNLEQRVTKLRQSNLDADPQVLSTAVQLSEAIGYTLGISVNTAKTRETSKTPSNTGKTKPKSSKPMTKQSSGEGKVNEQTTEKKPEPVQDEII